MNIIRAFAKLIWSSSRAIRPVKNRQRVRLEFEALENRVVRSATLLWTDADANNDATDAGNWSTTVCPYTNEIPEAGDDLLFSSAGSGGVSGTSDNCLIPSSISYSVSSITVDSTYSGTVTISSGATLTSSGDVSIGASATLNVEGTLNVGASSAASGTFVASGTTLGIYGVLDTSDFSVSAATVHLYASGSATVSGEFSADSAAAVDIDGLAGATIAGDLELDDSSSLALGGPTAGDPSDEAASLTVGGDFSVSASTFYIYPQSSATVTGSLGLGSSSSAYIDGDTSVSVMSGDLDVDDSSSLTVGNVTDEATYEPTTITVGNDLNVSAATLHIALGVTATINGSSSVNSGGGVSIDGYASVSIDGNLDVDATSDLTIGDSSLLEGTSLPWLTIGGAFTDEGTVTLNPDAFLASTGSITIYGTFSSFNSLISLGTGAEIDVEGTLYLDAGGIEAGGWGDMIEGDVYNNGTIQFVDAPGLADAGFNSVANAFDIIGNYTQTATAVLIMRDLLTLGGFDYIQVMGTATLETGATLTIVDELVDDEYTGPESARTCWHVMVTLGGITGGFQVGWSDSTDWIVHT